MSTRTLTVIRWLARGLCVALFLFWGAFFVEHLAYFVSGPPWPPLSVWLVQALHLLLLVGLLAALKWERLGAALIVVSAVIFFTLTARENALLFIAITAAPALLFLFLAIRPSTGAPLPHS
jgi:hypothetical protein